MTATRPRAIERLAFDDLTKPEALGHLHRYEIACMGVRKGDVVNDVACGIGYAAPMVCAEGGKYHGFDRRVVVIEAAAHFPVGAFHACDLDDPAWSPGIDADVTICFETLEHVEDPGRLAARLSRWTSRLLYVSVPTVPTMTDNPFHRHNFDVDDIPKLFPGWCALDLWEQRSESAHVWTLGWR